MIISPCYIELFGGLVVHQDQRLLSRFPTRKSAALLAYLAYFKEQTHGREQLMDRFWPEMEPNAARHNLRQTLFSLRRLLEPSDVPVGSVLIADKTHIRLNAKTVSTDVAEFRHLLQTAARSASRSERLSALEQAATLYKGELLPGLYDEWALLEQERLSAAFRQMLDEMAGLYIQGNRPGQAIDCLHRLVSADPFNAVAQDRLIHLYAACGHPERAHQQFQSFVGVMAAEWNEAPPHELCAFMDTLPLPRSPHTLPVLTVPFTLPTASVPLRIPSPHLPALLTRFFGREEELRQVQALLTSPQRCLVTLLGLGGSGKTRLAVEVGHRLAPAFQNAVYFVPLAGLSRVQAVPAAIAHALEWTLSPSSDPVEQIAAALESMPSLLILDNVEHLLPAEADAVEQIIERLMQRVATLRCLVTSRQRLNMEGEREFPVRPLLVPSSTKALAGLAHIPSVAMFLDRAQAIRPDFGLTASNAPALAALCQRLEGVPLALELAAAQIGVFSPAQMLAQLKDRFTFLVHRTRGIAPRHRSLHAALQWSFALLPPDLQSVFLRLSMFRGGWTLEAAKAVCGDEEIAASLHLLREASLITVEEQGDGLRFHMLEMMREFAATMLLESEQEAMGCHHADYFQKCLEEARTHLSRPQMKVWLDRLEKEYDNLSTALAWYRGHHPSDLYFTNLMWGFWYTRGYYWEAREWIAEALRRDTGEASVLRAQVLNAGGTLAWYQSEYDMAQLYFDEALTIYHQHTNQSGIATTLSNLSLLKRDQGDYLAARTLAEQSLETARQFQQPSCVAFALYNVGCAALLQEDYCAAEDALTECITFRREQGDFWGLGFTLTAQGDLACARGLRAQARSLFQESLDLFQNLSEQQGIADALHRLGKVTLADGERDRARDCLLESLQICHKTGHRTGISLLFCTLGLLSAAELQWTRAVMQFGFAHADGVHVPLVPTEADQVETAISAARRALGETDFGIAWATGAALTPAQAVTLARGT